MGQRGDAPECWKACRNVEWPSRICKRCASILPSCATHDKVWLLEHNATPNIHSPQYSCWPAAARCCTVTSSSNYALAGAAASRAALRPGAARLQRAVRPEVRQELRRGAVGEERQVDVGVAGEQLAQLLVVPRRDSRGDCRARAGPVRLLHTEDCCCLCPKQKAQGDVSQERGRHLWSPRCCPPARAAAGSARTAPSPRPAAASTGSAHGGQAAQERRLHPARACEVHSAKKRAARDHSLRSAPPGPGARTTWKAPSAPPPLSTSAVRPNACRVSRRKFIFSSSARSGPS